MTGPITVAPPGRWRAVRPLGYRDFRLLFAAVVLTVFAAGMWAVVMVYAVIGVGGGPLDLSLVATANAVGLLGCAIPGGIAADRLSRRWVLRGVLTVDILAIGSVVVVGAYGAVSIPQLAVVAALLGASSGFFFPSYSAILPRILPDEELLAANGLESAIRPALQQAAGPAAAGVLLSALLPSQAAIIITAAYIVALGLLFFVRRDTPDAAATRTSVIQDLREGVSFTLRTPWLLATLIYASLWVLLVLGPQEVLLPFITRERFGEDPALFGFLLAFFGAGGVAGSLFVSSLRLPRRYLSAMLIVWGLSMLHFIAIGVTNWYWVAAVSCFLTGFGGSYGNVIWGTLLQRRVPRHMLGRISSLDFFVSLSLMPLSMAIAGPLAEVVPIPVIFIVAGATPIGLALLALWVARLRRDEIAHPIETYGA